MSVRRIAVIIAYLTTMSPAAATDDTIAPHGQGAPGATGVEISEVLSTLPVDIKEPTVFGFGKDELGGWKAAAIKAHKEAPAVLGSGTAAPDVIIQLGHYPRTSGKTGGQGAYVNEQQMAAWVGTMLANDLSRVGVSVKVIPADGYGSGLVSKVFIALHTDASALPCSVGPSVGYGEASDARGMHGVAAALAITLGLDAAKFMRDNYTRNLSGYYAYKDVDASLFEGLLEMSELTCPDDEEQLLSKAEALAKNLSVALQFALRPAS